MLKSKDKIEVALTAALVAESVLQLMGAESKTSAKIIMSETVERMMKLDQTIKALVED